MEPRVHTVLPAAMLVSLAAAAANAQSFTPMGDLPGGATSSVAASVSADGTAVSGSSVGAAGPRGARWTLGNGLSVLSGAPAGLTQSSAYGISGNGSAIVGTMSINGGFSVPYRWTSAGGMVALPATPWPDNSATLSLCLSYDGGTVAGSTVDLSTGFNGAYRWSSTSGFSQVPLLPGTLDGTGYGLSGDGGTVVGYCSVNFSGDRRAFRWTAIDGTQDLGDLPGGSNSSTAFSVSHNGRVVVGGSYAASGEQPFRWTAATGMVELGNFASPVPNGQASACSGDGSVVVGQSRLGNDYEAFVWDAAHGMRSVRSVLASQGVFIHSDWKLQYAQDVSYDGTVIVGQGINPQGNTEGWIARLRPACPGDLNADGVVNTADLTIFLGNFGKTTIPLLGGDLDGSGGVNTADLTQFLGRFGSAC
jgi:probable HAF family extracellular repeat protein